MTTYDFIEQFITEHNGKHVNRQNFYIDGTFTSYSTDICSLDTQNKVAALNVHKYSRTTTKLQNTFKTLLTRHGYKINEFDGADCMLWSCGYCSSDNKWTVKELRERGIF